MWLLGVYPALTAQWFVQLVFAPQLKTALILLVRMLNAGKSGILVLILNFPESTVEVFGIQLNLDTVNG